MKKTAFTLTFCLITLISFCQLSINSTGTTTIDFDNTLSGVNSGNFNGSGFNNSPSNGQLNSNAFSITGLSDGSLSFGGSNSSGDFARGTSSGGVTTGGIYAFNTVSSGTDYCIGIQSTGSDFTPGEIVLKLTNNTSDGIYFTVTYDIKEYNDKNSSTSVQFSHSSDNSTYNSESSLDFNSTATAAGSPTWTTTTKTIDLLIPVSTSGSYYLKWSFDDHTSSGSRDEIGIDNIQITAHQVSVQSSMNNNGNESTLISSLSNSNSISSPSDGVQVWQLQLYDGNGSSNDNDTKPTIVRKLVLTKGASNEVSDWSSTIRKAALFRSSTQLDVATVYTDSIVFELTSSEGKISDNNNKIFDIYLSLKTSVTDLENFQFSLTEEKITLEDVTTSSQLGSYSTLTSDASKNEISVVPTAIAIETQPRSSIVNFNMTPSVEVKLTDANGNTDLSGNGSAQLRITSSGTLSTSPQTATINSTGVAQFSTINHTTAGNNLQLTIEDFNDYLNAGSATALTSDQFDIIAADDLIISEVTSPSDNSNAKFVELYNAGSTEIDFSTTTYYLAVQFNGNTISNTQLTGSIPAKGIYTIASNSTQFNSAYSATPDKTYSFLGNGNDAIILYKNGNNSSGTITDIYGVFDENGTGQNWEYSNGKATRNSVSTTASPNWNSSDWTVSTSSTTSSTTPKRLSDEIRFYSSDGWVGGTPDSGTGLKDLVVQSGSATISSDVSCNSFSVLNGGSVAINASQTLTVTNNVTITGNGALTIDENGSLYQTSNSATNTGSIQFKRSGWSNTIRYNIWSSPVSNSSITSTFSNANPCDVYVFDADVQNWKYDFTPNSGSYTCNGNTGIQFGNTDVISTGGADGIMDIGRGYYIPGNTSSSSYTMTGIPNNGDYSFNIYAATNPGGVAWNDDNWNLLGNPYPCAIDLSSSNSNSFLNVNSSKITGDFYFWIDDGDTANYDQNADFAVFNNTGGTTANGVQATRYVPAGRGFWVKAIADGTINFNNSMKVSGNNTSSYKTDTKNHERVSLTLRRNNLSQNILIGLNPNTTMGYDIGWDAPKMDNGGALVLASICDSGQFAIQSIPPPLMNSPKTVPLLINTKKSGYHRLGIDNSNEIAPQTAISLLDVAQNTSYNLLSGEAKLELDSGLHKNRFFIQFHQLPETSDTSTVSIHESIKSTIATSFIDGQLVLSGEELNQYNSFTLFDLMGRIVTQKSISGNLVNIYLNKNLSKGSYIITLNGIKQKQIRLIIP